MGNEDQPSATSEQTAHSFPQYAQWGCVALIVIAGAALRWHLIDVPLDRDEGGYAYGGQLLLDGYATYTDYYTMRYPAIFGAYAFIMAIFGETHTGIHTALLFMNAITAVFLFLLGRRLFSPLAGIAAAAYFEVLNLSPVTEGFSANSEQFVILFAAAGLWHLVRTIQLGGSYAFILTGLLMSMAYLMKQHGIVFIAFAGIILIAEEFRRKERTWKKASIRIACYGGGVLAPIALTCIWLAATGRFDDFWYWTVSYARAYAVGLTPEDGYDLLRGRVPRIVRPMLPIWALVFGGCIAVWDTRWRSQALFCTLLLILSCAAVSIGLYFRPHYFRLLFPAAATMAGLCTVAIAQMATQKNRRIAVGALVIVGASLYGLYTERELLFQLSPEQVSRRISGLNPFPESFVIADYIRDHTEPDEVIAVIGSEPQIYFYANRVAATGHIYTYQLVENHPFASDMQRQMIAEIEEAAPPYLVIAFGHTSWLTRHGADLSIIVWTHAYAREFYTPVGLIDVLRGEPTRYYWDDEVEGVIPESSYSLAVYKRNPE